MEAIKVISTLADIALIVCLVFVMLRATSMDNIASAVFNRLDLLYNRLQDMIKGTPTVKVIEHRSIDETYRVFKNVTVGMFTTINMSSDGHILITVFYMGEQIAEVKHRSNLKRALEQTMFVLITKGFAKKSNPECE